MFGIAKTREKAKGCENVGYIQKNKVFVKFALSCAFAININPNWSLESSISTPISTLVVRESSFSKLMKRVCVLQPYS